MVPRRLLYLSLILHSDALHQSHLILRKPRLPRLAQRTCAYSATAADSNSEKGPVDDPSETKPAAKGNGNGNGNGAMASRKWPFSSDEEYSWYLEDISRPYWRRQTKVQWVGQWPVGDPLANPEVGGKKGLRSIQWFRGLRDDFGRKYPLYASDWADGFRSNTKSLAAISFLYFACLAPVLAFGGAMAGLTQGAMGVAEVIASCGICGMAYATIAGQPMTFVAPTGLTLAFTAALYKWCLFFTIPFLPMYAWVGCWTSLMMIFASVINASGLIRYCTRFTEDVSFAAARTHTRLSQLSLSLFLTPPLAPNRSSTLFSPSTSSPRPSDPSAPSSKAPRPPPTGYSPSTAAS